MNQRELVAECVENSLLLFRVVFRERPNVSVFVQNLSHVDVEVLRNELSPLLSHARVWREKQRF